MTAVGTPTTSPETPSKTRSEGPFFDSLKAKKMNILTFATNNWKWLAPLAFGLVGIIVFLFAFKPNKKAPTVSPPATSSAPTTKQDQNTKKWYQGWFSWVKMKRLRGIPDKKTNIIPVGYFLGPVTAHLWFGAIIFVGSIVLVAMPFTLLIAPLNPQVFFNPIVYWTLLVGLTAVTNIGAWSITERRTVPNNHVLPLKVLGRIINVLLVNGEYVIPLFPLLASNQDNVTGDVVVGSDENSEDKAKKGLIYVGTITVHLGKEDGNGTGLMTAAAADRANVGLRMTLSYECIGPLQRLQRNRPIKDMNAAARDSIRQAVAGTATSDQINDLQNAISKLVANRWFYSVRTRSSNATSGVHGGNLVTYAADGRIICLVEDNELVKGSAELTALIKEVEDKGNEDMKNAARNANGTFEHFSVHVAKGFMRALDENGYTLKGLPRIDEIKLPDPVTAAAAQAAAEVGERQAALATAETSRLAGNQLTKGGTGLTGTDAAWAGIAANNPGVKIVHVPGLKNGGGNVIINGS